jgi:hypothetical protein
MPKLWIGLAPSLSHLLHQIFEFGGDGYTDEHAGCGIIELSTSHRATTLSLSIDRLMTTAPRTTFSLRTMHAAVVGRQLGRG